MARRAASGIDEEQLTKGQLRKLSALRKSLGEEIADRAFSEWLASSPSASPNGADRNAEVIADSLSKLANEGKLMIPCGGYVVRRGRGRVIVERNASTD